MNRKWLWLGIVMTAGVIMLTFAGVVTIKVLLSDQPLVSRSGIGLVEIKGIIIDSQGIVKQLHEFMNNDSIKAVVVRIDSPGGVVAPSQEIHSEIKKLAGKKKVLVSMGSIAASGGYYIAVPAAIIYANPGTITGSIGVLMKFSNLEGLMGRIGMKAFTLKTGRYKDVGSPVRTMSDDEKGMLQAVIDNTHSQFVRAVSEGRKLPIETVKLLADGRIFTGEQAVTLKLVDRIGTLQDAVEEAARLSGIKGEPQVVRPPRKRNAILDLLIEDSTAKIAEFVRQEKGFSMSYELDDVSAR